MQPSFWLNFSRSHNWEVGAGPHFGKQRVETCRTLSPRQKALQTPKTQKHRGGLRLGVGGWGDKRGSGKEFRRHKYTCTTMRSRIPLFITIKCADLKIDKSNSTWTCWYAAAMPCPFLIRKAGVEKKGWGVVHEQRRKGIGRSIRKKWKMIQKKREKQFWFLKHDLWKLS